MIKKWLQEMVNCVPKKELYKTMLELKELWDKQEFY